MTAQAQTRKIGPIGIVVVLALAGAAGWAIVHFRSAEHGNGKNAKSGIEATTPSAKRPIPRMLELSPTMVAAIHLNTVAAVVPSFSKVLHLRGSLALDPNRLSHVHARFPGQIVELATVAGLRSQQTDPSAPRARLIQNFDYVTEGTTLAVMQSKDLGEKKSQLAEALTKYRVEKKTLDNFQAMSAKGIFPERQVRDQEAKAQLAKIAVSTAENTLRAFNVTEPEIDRVKESAEKIHRGLDSDNSYISEWSRVVVTAPITGDIVEKSIIVGDIVDANADLFKISDLSVLAVYLHPYEEDLQTLDSLPKPLQVRLRVPAFPELGELPCHVDRSSPLIDPNEHMALLIGRVNNPDRKLKGNQFVTADVGAPAEKGVVEIPSSSVIDLGSEAIVFVQADSAKTEFQRRNVVIVQRYFDVVYVRSELTKEQEAQGFQAIHAGDQVMKGWILELEDYFQQQR